MSKTVAWVVEEWDDRKQKYLPVSVFSTMRDARSDYKKRKRFYDVRLQTYLRADL